MIKKAFLLFQVFQVTAPIKLKNITQKNKCWFDFPFR